MQPAARAKKSLNFAGDRQNSSPATEDYLTVVNGQQRQSYQRNQTKPVMLGKIHKQQNLVAARQTSR
ncbi:MAG: hypothetical protein SAJ37_09665 [Oscillatoria sp. PMC 1068.18]|nr:hypothetical protein [Oscillatoria sp. PMC 1076.18]MEC4989002.1 hypothetical protein [Oscillatoria sp. PMC 1068.18]